MIIFIQKNAITEMIFAYEKFSTIKKKIYYLLPSDYPYLYTKDEAIVLKIYLGENYHWRKVSMKFLCYFYDK